MDIESILNPYIKDTDIEILSNLYLRIAEDIKFDKDKIKHWVGLGIRSLANEIYEKTKNSTVVFELRQLDFDDAHFQEEAIYCATQGWVSKFYNLEIHFVEIEFDQKKNMFEFYIPQ